MAVLFQIETFEIGLTFFRKRVYIKDLRTGRRHWPSSEAVHAYFQIAAAARERPLTFDQRQHVMLVGGLGFVAATLDPGGYAAFDFRDSSAAEFVERHAHAYTLATDETLVAALGFDRPTAPPQPRVIYHPEDLAPGPWDRHSRLEVGLGWYMWAAQDNPEIWVFSIPSSGPIKADPVDSKKFWLTYHLIWGHQSRRPGFPSAYLNSLRIMFCRCVANHLDERGMFRNLGAPELANLVVTEVNERIG